MPDRDRRLGRVLLVTRNLPPLRGGMERLVGRIARSLCDDWELCVVGPTGCTEQLPRSARVDEVPSAPLWNFLLRAAVAVRKKARANSYDIVLAGSGLTAPLAWWGARRSGARFAVYLHGLDIIAPSAIYRRLWLPVIRRADLAFVNSRNTRRLAIESGVPASIIEVLHPGTDIPGPDLDRRVYFRERMGLGDSPLMLSVGRLTPRKGLAEFIENSLPAVLAQQRDAILLVIGADASDAVSAPVQSELARIQEAANKAGLAQSVRMLPPCDDMTLSDAYRAADTYIFPVLDLPGDVEGFGMVAIEAAAHGLPTVGFGVGGVPDAIAGGWSGSLVEPGDYRRFSQEVIGWLKRRGHPQVAQQCVKVAQGFSWDRFGSILAQKLRALVATRG